MRENIDQLWLWGIILIGIRHELGSTKCTKNVLDDVNHSVQRIWKWNRLNQSCRSTLREACPWFSVITGYDCFRDERSIAVIGSNGLIFQVGWIVMPWLFGEYPVVAAEPPTSNIVRHTILVSWFSTYHCFLVKHTFLWYNYIVSTKPLESFT